MVGGIKLDLDWFSNICVNANAEFFSNRIVQFFLVKSFYLICYWFLGLIFQIEHTVIDKKD